MTAHWIAPDQLFDGQDVRAGMAICVKDGQVTDLASAPKNALHINGLICPGFVDLQVNGGGGVMLNSDPTPNGVRTIAQAHRRFGTTWIMPTVITDHPDVLDQAADAMIALAGTPGLVGLHIEGPHISIARRGTHKAAFVRPLDQRTFEVVARLLAADVPVMITVAPEATTPEGIAKLVQMGAIVSLGHTDATSEDIQAALAAGATVATHLFNAMSPMLGRSPGAVGAVINADCYAGIICDGHHVADAMVGLAIRARPKTDTMFLVSDAMATVGGPDQFQLYGAPVHLREGKLVNTEGGLAGAHVTQAEGVKRLVEKTGTPLESALRMAVSTPATCIGRADIGQLRGRPLGEVIVLNDDLTYRGDLGAVLGQSVDAAE